MSEAEQTTNTNTTAAESGGPVAFSPEALFFTVFGENAEGIGVTWTTPDDRGGWVEYTGADDPEFLHSRRAEAEVSEGVGGFKNSAVLPAEGLPAPCLIRLARGEERTEASLFRPISEGAKNGGEVNFLVMSDTSDENYGDGRRWRPALEHAAENYPGAEFIVHAGDFVQLSGKRTEWANLTATNAEYLNRLPMIPAAGNHEYWKHWCGGYDATFYKHFTLSLPPQEALFGAYYSVNVGLVHITVLTSGESVAFGEERTLSPEQEDWMIADLKAAETPWKIVVIHNPFYSPGNYGCGNDRVARDLRRRYCDFFAEAKVDLVFTAHDHVCSRTYPMTGDGIAQRDVRMTGRGDDRTVYDPEGPVYIVCGVCGDQARLIHPEIRRDQLAHFEYISSHREFEAAYFSVRADADRIEVINNVVRFKDGETVRKEKYSICKNPAQKPENQ